MAILKCKMCGGNLNIEDEPSVVECEYCGTKQTVPTADNEKKMTLFARANRLRSACEFDKAAGVYESIVAEFPEEAEAYWGLVLCKYGIEYVDDPATGKKIPTCHRSSFDSIMDDSDFEQVMENADSIARRVYREEAKTIEEIRKGILEVSSREEPYDIFICYKETDENGERTIDSVIAQDIYDNLTEKGYRVFFARISLEDKLGTAYEPYIFAALNSAKIMLAVGTDYDYYNAVWVKNEWSRFLALIAKGEKKTLIPCYKDIDAYDIPKEFKHLQAQDMGKVGAMQDLLRGIGKILGSKIQNVPSYNVVDSNVSAMIQRGNMALEDGDFLNAVSFFERALDANPAAAHAYLGKFLAFRRLTSTDDLQDKVCAIDNDKEFRRAEQFADTDLAKELKKIKEENELKIQRLRFLDAIRKALNRQKKLEKRYSKARSLQETGETYNLLKAVDEFKALGNYKDSAEQIKECLNTCEEIAAADRKRLLESRNRITQYTGIIAARDNQTVGLKSDGAVVVVGGNGNSQCDVEEWTDIVAIAEGNEHTVGLKSDGTVCVVFGQCDVKNWKDITAIAAGCKHTVGLKSDGTVDAVGSNYKGKCDVKNWTDIVAIAAGDWHTVGLKSDGTVVAVGSNACGQCNVKNWTDIVAIAASDKHTVGLKIDGTVVAVGSNFHGQCDVKNWTDIKSIAAGERHTVGLKSDGTVVAVGDNDKGQRNVKGWTNIVAIAAGNCHTVGLKSNGTVVAVGKNDKGQCNVKGWKLFIPEEDKQTYYVKACAWQESGGEMNFAEAASIFSSLKDYKDSAKRAEKCNRAYKELKAEREAREKAEREAEEKAKAEREARERAEKAAAAEAERQRRIASLNDEKNSLQTELANLKGLFTGKRRKQIEARLAEIETELKRL